MSRDNFNQILSENLILSTTNIQELGFGKLPHLVSKSVYSNELVSYYSSIEEGDIIIFNKSLLDNCINVRVRVKSLGSDHFFSVHENKKRVWRRSPGIYLAEILNSQYQSQRFYLETGNIYEFHSKQILYNVTQKIYMENVVDFFNHITYITKLDKSLGGFTDIDIIYDNNAIFEVKNKDYEIPYYNNIPPEYKKGKKFIDQTFSCNVNQINAMCNNSKKYIKPHFRHLPPKTIEISNLEFLTPKQIFNGKKVQLFQDEIEVSDVKQGLLGNCYLISIIAAISEREDLIRRIFKTKTYNSEGFYEIYFYDIDGTKKIMFVDDYFPYLDINGDGIKEFLGTIPNGEEIWVMLLEKAYAKYEGGWCNIEGGTISSELQFFTGFNTKNLSLKSPTAWIEILNACKRDNIVCSRSKKGTGSHSDKSEKNIANSHAYTILEADEYKGLKLLKVRNPWGEMEWKGDYCDNSPLWNEELRAYFNFIQENKDDGIFCISFEDFCIEFNDVVICYC